MKTNPLSRFYLSALACLSVLNLVGMPSFADTIVIPPDQRTNYVSSFDEDAWAVPNEVLVQFDLDDTLLGNASTQELQLRLPEIDIDRIERLPEAQNLVSIAFRTTDEIDSVAKAVEAIKNKPGVLYAQPNYVLRQEEIANDPYYNSDMASLPPQLWGVYSDDNPPFDNPPEIVGPQGTISTYGTQVEKTWNNGFIGSRNICVAIIDQGMEWEHPDLRENIWTNPGEIPDNNIDDDNNGYKDDVHGWDFRSNNSTIYDGTSKNDVDSHGTHVAGIIGAMGGNGEGIVGMNWQVTMIPVKFLGKNGGTTEDARRAFDYLIALKKKYNLNLVAINCSWGHSKSNSALFDSIKRAAQEEILTVCAAGNSTEDNDERPMFPANFDTTIASRSLAGTEYNGIISVASLDRDGELSSFSNYGKRRVHLAAPGSGIWSTWPHKLEEQPHNGYRISNGTSMAAPFVTGAIALYAAIKASTRSPVDPPVTAAAIKAAILNNVQKTPSLEGKTITGGRLNAVWEVS